MFDNTVDGRPGNLLYCSRSRPSEIVGEVGRGEGRWEGGGGAGGGLGHPDPEIRRWPGLKKLFSTRPFAL